MGYSTSKNTWWGSWLGRSRNCFLEQWPPSLVEKARESKKSRNFYTELRLLAFYKPIIEIFVLFLASWGGRPKWRLLAFKAYNWYCRPFFVRCGGVWNDVNWLLKTRVELFVLFFVSLGGREGLEWLLLAFKAYNWNFRTFLLSWGRGGGV